MAKEEVVEKETIKNNSKEKLLDKFRKNPWMAASVVLIAVLVIVIMVNGGLTGGAILTGNVVNSENAGSSLVDFLNKRTGGGITLDSVEELGNSLYQVNVIYEGQKLPVYITKDGKYFVSAVTAMNPSVPSDSSSNSGEIVKSDKPIVELFVMTHCPYGTQAEKGFIPMMRALEDVADLKIRFVHYYMHTNGQEEVETPRQVCIREEQSDLYLDYLECFLGGSSGSISEASACAAKVGINGKKLSDCLQSGRADEYYAEDSELSNSYGVRGSPALVINGNIVKSGRDSASYLATVCSAFNNAPEECAVELSGSSPSPGFGYNAGTGSDTGQC